MDIDLFII